MIWLWVGFFALVVVLLALDLGVFHRESHAISVREAAAWTILWIALGLSFGGLVYLIYEQGWMGAEAGTGGEALVSYLTAYLLEKSLSIDNIFVISLIFTRFRVKAEYQHRVLFWGILGAIVMRGAVIAGGVWLVQSFDWIFYVFGAWLVYAGIKSLRSEDELDPEHSRMMRLVRRMVPVVKGDEHGGKFLSRTRRGRRALTMLALALLAVEFTDLIFALDSIPAVLAVTPDPFLIVTSNVFAILGLRALYFVLAGMLDSFRYLKYSLAALLVVIGVKMLLHQLIHIPNLVSFAVIVAIVATGLIASVLADRRDARRTALAGDVQGGVGLEESGARDQEEERRGPG